MQFINAAFLKLKRSIVCYLPLAVVCFCCAGVGAALVMDPHFSVQLDENPWDKLIHGGLVLYLVMLYSPMLIILVSAVFYIEEKANAWKLLFVQPISRNLQYGATLLSLVSVALFTSLLMLIGIVLTGNLVALLIPEYGFTYHSPNWAKLIGNLGHGLIAGLGVIGIQQLINLRFRNILISFGIGTVGFILAFILTVTESQYALYLPYTYPIIVPELDTFQYEFRQYPIPGFTNAELYSLGWFVVTISMGLLYNNKRDVD